VAKPPTREQIATAVRPVISRWYDTGGNLQERIADAVLALFPQPTPTAEPVCGGSATNCIHRFHPPMHSMACPVGQAQNHPPSPAEPVSIADMTPGTRCREEVSGTVPSWAGEDQISPCLCVLATGHDGRHQCSHQVDPSTIRDVTPPPTTPGEGS
jgi:hypothetical protein